MPKTDISGLSTLPVQPLAQVAQEPAPSEPPPLSSAADTEPIAEASVAPVPQADIAPAPEGQGPVLTEPTPAPGSQTAEPGPKVIATPTTPRQVAPKPVAPAAPPVMRFEGPVFNRNLNRGGMLSLEIRKVNSSDEVIVQFHAWAGLIGTGEPTGTVSGSGEIAASGRLMMGRNPFETTLQGRIIGGELNGSATFVRRGGPGPSFSTFSLRRS